MVDFLPVGEIEWKVVEFILKNGKNKVRYENWLIVCLEDETVECINWILIFPYLEDSLPLTSKGWLNATVRASDIYRCAVIV